MEYMLHKAPVRLVVMNNMLLLTLAAWILSLHCAVDAQMGKLCNYIGSPSGKFADCTNHNLTEVPSNIENDTSVLDLSKNLISVLNNNSFTQLIVLLQLNISSNNLSVLQKRAFYGLDKLEVLNLRANYLLMSSEVFNQVFKPLKYLKVLYIDENLVNENSTYLDTTIGQCSNLNVLHIPGLFNVSFRPGYLGFESLRDLTLGRSKENKCDVRFVKNDTFAGISSLQKLNLSDCRIQSVEMCSFCNLKRLHTLDMSHNSPGGLSLIRNITYSLQFTNVTVMRFTHVESEFAVGIKITKYDLEFANRTKIKRLFVSSNMIEFLEDGAIDLFPPDLEEIDLSDNRPIIGPYITELIKLKNLKILKADSLNMYHYFIVAPWPKKEFRSLPQGVCFKLPQKLEELSSKNSRIPYDFMNINFCDNNSLKTVKLDKNAISKWKGPLKGLNKLKLVDLSANLCEEIYDNFFIYMTTITILNLRKNFIGYVIEKNVEQTKLDCPWLKPLKNVKELDLSLNKIRILPKECFSTLVSLEKLDLKENSISDWEVDISHIKNISKIDLSGNGIDSFPKETTDHLSEVSKRRTVEINLADNKLECTCETIEFLEWFESANITFIGKENYTCRDKHWRELKLRDVALIIAGLKKECADYTYLNTILSVIIGCFILAVFYGIYYRYRWQVSYCYYMTWGRYNLVQEVDKEKYCYDAYVSCSEEDRNFVEGTLAVKLESLHGLSLYIFDRDGIPGHPNNALVVDNIQKSRKTIVILTKSYLKSQRCLFELYMAIARQTYKNNTDQLIYFVKYESIPKADIPTDIMGLFNSDSFIDYPHDPQGNTIFWERLKTAIKPTIEETPV